MSGGAARRGRARRGAVPAVVLAAIACLSPARGERSPAAPPLPAGREERLARGVGLDQKPGAQVPLDAPFRDEEGRPVTCGELLRGKPVMLVLIQYRCTMLCSEQMSALTASLNAMRFSVGKQFDVLTVSIDAREMPDLARQYRDACLRHYARPEAARGWRFLTGGEASIRRVAEAVGFRFVYDERTDQFAHPDGVILLTPQGRVARYFFRLEYPPRDLRLGLVEASAGRIGTPLDAMALLCFQYSPVTGRYGLVVMRVVRAAALATVLLIALGVALLHLRGRRAAAALAGKEGVR